MMDLGVLGKYVLWGGVGKSGAGEKERGEKGREGIGAIWKREGKTGEKEMEARVTISGTFKIN